MSKEARVLEALLAHLEDLETQSPALPIAYDEHAEEFKPPNDGKYLVAKFFPNAPFWSGLSEGRLDHGLLQVTLVWPKNDGEIYALEAVSAVMAHFPLASSYYSMGTAVKITGQPYYSIVHEDKQVRFPITIPWSA